MAFSESRRKKSIQIESSSPYLITNSLYAIHLRDISSLFSSYIVRINEKLKSTSFGLQCIDL